MVRRMDDSTDRYPVDFAVEYPDRNLDRLTSFFRFLTVIPIAILLGTLSGFSTSGTDFNGTTVTIAFEGVGILFLPVLLMLLFRGKYPRWWFDWNIQLQRFVNRVAVYALLMDDRYPSTDEAQAVTLEYGYPGGRERAPPWHAAGQVAARDPALHRADLPDRGVSSR